jgi:hypothetical protein
MVVEIVRRGEFETALRCESPGKYRVETRTGRRFKASACRYNRRVKLSLISLIQLKFGLAHGRPRGYHMFDFSTSFTDDTTPRGVGLADWSPWSRI